MAVKFELLWQDMADPRISMILVAKVEVIEIKVLVTVVVVTGIVVETEIEEDLHQEGDDLVHVQDHDPIDVPGADPDPLVITNALLLLEDQDHQEDHQGDRIHRNNVHCHQEGRNHLKGALCRQEHLDPLKITMTELL